MIDLVSVNISIATTEDAFPAFLVAYLSVIPSIIVRDL